MIFIIGRLLLRGTGIVLLAVLFIFLLLVLAPLRYQAKAEGSTAAPSRIKVRVKVSCGFGLAGYTLEIKNHMVQGHFRLAGIGLKRFGQAKCPQKPGVSYDEQLLHEEPVLAKPPGKGKEGKRQKRRVKGGKAPQNGQGCKIALWEELLHLPQTRPALQKAAEEAWRLFVHIRPRSAGGWLSFSFSDPERTGLILALAGITLPIHRNSVRLLPSFTHEDRAEAELLIKGRILPLLVITVLARVWFDRNVQALVKIIRRRRYGKQQI